MPATSRLTFLYPQLLRSTRAAAQAVPQQWATVESRAAAASRKSHLHSARAKSTFAPRVGKAVAPDTWEKQDPIELPAPGEEPVAEVKQAPADTVPEPATNEATSQTPVEEAAAAAAAAAAQSTAESAATNKPDEPVKAEETASEEPGAPKTREETKAGSPLEAVMHMQPPEDTGLHIPAMSPPPYVHHFDSYSLVKHLEEGGFTPKQAVTSMKAIRSLLAVNLDVALKSLVSKNDIENETYLFAAACSELNTEVKNNQRIQEERMRQERTHVQHEVEVLNQSLAAELVTLNDNVRGMFNDRKMAAREEQKAIDSAIQKLNYKISIMLTSEAKSEIEGVRWVLIQRSVLGIVFLVLITLAALRYTTSVKHQRKQEAEEQKKKEEEAKVAIGRQDNTAAPDAAEILAAN